MTNKAKAKPAGETKAAKLINLLQTRAGASLEDMTEATGWLPHTVRAAMTGLRKKGYVIEKGTLSNTSVWLIKAAS